MLNEKDTAPEAVARNRCSYDPSDNKLRLYLAERVERDSYHYLRSIGFVATPKQDCSFAATWSVAAEDACFALIPDDADIGDESYSPEDRAADRAERFSGYRDKRRSEAGGFADRYESGPAVFGNQNRQRAERQARRHERLRDHALSQWSKAEYWQLRTAGVIAHALHRLQPSVRRRRILRLESELRKHEAGVAKAVERWEAWQRVAEETNYERQNAMAKRLAGASLGWTEYPHPDEPEYRTTLCTLMEPYEGSKRRPITGAEASRLFLEASHPEGPGRPGTSNHRYTEHLKNRLAYEKAMLEAEGGMAGDVEMIPGGFIGKHQIHGVNKSPATGRVVSVKLMAPKRFWNGEGEAPLVLQSFNIERLGEDAYRTPTDLELKEFEESQKAAKKAAKASKPKAPSLVNPFDEDAERLQSILNELNRKAGHAADSEVVRMTQAEYSVRSKGSYGPCETTEITEKLRPASNRWGTGGRSGRVVVFKVRTQSGGSFGAARRVVVLTDKPQKAIPWKAAEEVRATMPSEETHGPQLTEFFRLKADYGYEFSEAPTPEERDRMKQLRQDYGYLGWANIECANQFSLTETGRAMLAKYGETEAVVR